MNTRLNRRPTPASPPQPTDPRRRSRWPVFFGALALVWCAWWYCRGESQALLILASALAALALARTRALPGTARWIIWSGVFIAVACLAANVSRLVPPDAALAETRLTDRIVTAAFAVGLTALFFRPAIAGVTWVAAGGLSLIMVVLLRNDLVPGAASGYETLTVWGLVALLITADLAQRLARPPGSDVRPAQGLREGGWRLVLLAAVVTLAFGLRLPVEWTAKRVQKGLLGWSYAERARPQRAGDLWLTVPTSSDFDTRTRMVLLIRADGLPGYLRERVFTLYRGGRWVISQPESPLKETSAVLSAHARSVYELTPVPHLGTSLVWRVEVLSPALLAGFCLPGSTVSLTCDGAPPVTDVNGTVAAKETLPDTYGLSVAPTRLLDSAYPWPRGQSDPAYLDIPVPLAGAASNWVSACEGLSAAPTVGESIRCVETYFAKNFTYRLGLRMNATPDPLVDFMSRKTGSCTLFASAAAMMFRSRGIPSRVVAGYVCSCWNPWLKRWVVRERDGHAWAEVWDRAAGRWLVADPTPPAGNPAAFKKPSALRLALDLLSAGWKRFLVFLKGASLLDAVAAIGETLVNFLWAAVLSLPGIVVLSGFGAVWWLRRRMGRRRLTPEERVRTELVRAMEQVERHAVPAPLRRRGNESWNAWLLRIGPELPPARLDELREWTESYQALRYRVTLDEAEARTWLARAHAATKGIRGRGNRI